MLKSRMTLKRLGHSSWEWPLVDFSIRQQTTVLQQCDSVVVLSWQWICHIHCWMLTVEFKMLWQFCNSEKSSHSWWGCWLADWPVGYKGRKVNMAASHFEDGGGHSWSAVVYLCSDIVTASGFGYQTWPAGHLGWNGLKAVKAAEGRGGWWRPWRLLKSAWRSLLS